MIAYHGTNRRSANKIVGPPTGVKVNLDGGELGRGFYLGENVSLAAALAVGKYGQANAAVVKCDLDDASYIRLNIKNIHHRPAVIRLWRSLVRRGKHVTHTPNCMIMKMNLHFRSLVRHMKFLSLRTETRGLTTLVMNSDLAEN